MIRIGRHTDYAARIVLHLACLDEGTQVTAGVLADEGLLPPAFVRRIVGRLAAAGIVRTLRGSGGGVTLARRPADISLLEVVRAMEDGPTLNACVDDASSCPLTVGCPVNRAWAEVTAQLVTSLDAVRFDRLAKSCRPGTFKSSPRLAGDRISSR